jgi:hypothetical protein
MKNLVNYKDPAALVCYDTQGRQRQIILYLDFEKKIITVKLRDNYDKNHILGFYLPPNVDASALGPWIEERIMPWAKKALAGYKVEEDRLFNLNAGEAVAVILALCEGERTYQDTFAPTIGNNNATP